MFKKILSTIFLVLGLIFILQGFFDLSKRLGVYKAPPTTSTIYHLRSTSSSSIPAKIAISSLNLSLPVEPTLIENGTWPTSQIGVSFLKNSGTIGSTGNLIFYGHNWRSLLGNLSKVKVGDSVVLSATNNQQYLYSVAFIAVVDQKDVSILADTNDERITLYTCTGLLDQKRLVVVAKRV